MEELTKEQIEKHIKSNELWVRSQQNFLDNLVIQSDNAQRMIKNHTELIALNNEQIPIEEKYFVEGKKNFADWCTNNEIEIPDWAK